MAKANGKPCPTCRQSTAKYVEHEASLVCDGGCRLPFTKGETRWSCCNCDFDVCDTCVEKHELIHREAELVRFGLAASTKVLEALPVVEAVEAMPTESNGETTLTVEADTSIKEADAIVAPPTVQLWGPEAAPGEPEVEAAGAAEAAVEEATPEETEVAAMDADEEAAVAEAEAAEPDMDAETKEAGEALVVEETDATAQVTVAAMTEVKEATSSIGAHEDCFTCGAAFARHTKHSSTLICDGGAARSPPHALCTMEWGGAATYCSDHHSQRCPPTPPYPHPHPHARPFYLVRILPHPIQAVVTVSRRISCGSLVKPVILTSARAVCPLPRPAPAL